MSKEFFRHKGEQMYEGSITVSMTIFAITIATSLYGLLANPRLVNSFMMRPHDIAHEGKFWQLITSGLVHGDFGHLIFNMLTFYFFALPLEGNYLGSANFFLLYMISLIVSDIPSLIRHRHDEGYASLGASGAISGVLFSYILFNPTARIYAMFIPMPAFVFAVLYLVYCWYAGRNAQDNVNHDAHLWGALTGLIFTLIVEPGSGANFLQSWRNIF